MRRGGSSARGLVLAGLVALACSGCGGDGLPSEMDEPLERLVEALEVGETVQYQFTQERYTDGIDEEEMAAFRRRWDEVSEVTEPALRELLDIAGRHGIEFGEVFVVIRRRLAPHTTKLRYRYPRAAEEIPEMVWEE